MSHSSNNTRLVELRVLNGSLSIDQLLNILDKSQLELPCNIWYPIKERNDKNEFTIFWLEFSQHQSAIDALKLNIKNFLSLKLTKEIDFKKKLSVHSINLDSVYPKTWICDHCAFQNSYALSFCPRCLLPRDKEDSVTPPSSTSATSTNINQHSPTGPPVGSLFNPLILGQNDNPIQKPAMNSHSVISPELANIPLPSSQISISPISISPTQRSPPQNLFDVLASLPKHTPNQYTQKVNSKNPEPLQDLETLSKSPQSPKSQLPPILNTGSQGPMQMQPGDWICSCGFVNWRRRKYCYKCFPFANGNNSEELQKAAQKAAQLASLPENFGNNSNFENHNLNMSQVVLENKIDNPSINFFTNVQSHPGSVDHHSPITKSKYKASSASKKAWGNDIYNVHQHGLIEGMPHNDETFNEIKEIFYNSN
ncbi:hypothetical protein E3Q13_03928 [Wallemia mellicola]|nr:hypothetical protein E3Q13_03928 [Wallemia mellicola]